MQQTLFITTTPGLEPALAKECVALGLAPQTEPGGVTVRTEEGAYRRLNMELRCASRVLLRVAEVGLGELGRIALREYWDGQGEVEIAATVHEAHARASELESKARRAWRLPNVAPTPEEAALHVQLRLAGDRCAVSIDTSGELLNRRGYRQEGSHAPLRETLAAGLLGLVGYDGTTPFWDPMCGSGTIAIEAAMIAAKKAPGLDRSFAFEKFPNFDPEVMEKERALLRERIVKPKVPVHGTDIHAGALGAARRNGRRAGVAQFIKLERIDVAELQPPGTGKGVVVVNPPYGKRVGERGDLVALFTALGQTLRTTFKGWRYGVLVPERKLEVALGLKPREVHRIQNGGLWVNFLVGG